MNIVLIDSNSTDILYHSSLVDSILSKESKRLRYYSCAVPDGLVLLLPVFHNFSIKLRDLGAAAVQQHVLSHFSYYGTFWYYFFVLRRQ